MPPIASSAPQRFSKAERLSSKKIIGQLIQEGISFQEYPLKFIYSLTQLPSSYPVQVCVSAPKRKFPLAVSRNKVKRRIRESYRHHKGLLYEHFSEQGQQLALMIMFTGRPGNITYTEIDTAVVKGIRRLTDIHEKDETTA